MSCTYVCGPHGGYSECTRTYAGSDGTLGNCDSLLTALGYTEPGSTVSYPDETFGGGCFVKHFAYPERFWDAATPTTADAWYVFGKRACACNN